MENRLNDYPQSTQSNSLRNYALFKSYFQKDLFNQTKTLTKRFSMRVFVCGLLIPRHVVVDT